MRFNSLKTFAAVAVIAVAAMSGQASAQVDNQTINVTLATDSAIDVLKTADIDFGSWFVVVRSGETPTLTLTPGGGVSAVAAGVTNSTLTELTAGTGPGQITVEVPAATVMTMTRSGTVAFTDTGIDLSAVTYDTATESGNIDADSNTGAVTILAGSMPENVDLGAELTFTATPDDANSPHTASFVLTLAY
jgi:hypothetical protein